MRRVMIAVGLLLALGGTAAADIRIDDKDPVRQRPAPPPPPQAEQGGCSSKSVMAPEWVFAIGALGAGGYFLRRQRHAA